MRVDTDVVYEWKAVRNQDRWAHARSDLDRERLASLLLEQTKIHVRTGCAGTRVLSCLFQSPQARLFAGWAQTRNRRDRGKEWGRKSASDSLVAFICARALSSRRDRVKASVKKGESSQSSRHTGGTGRLPRRLGRCRSLLHCFLCPDCGAMETGRAGANSHEMRSHLEH